MPRRDSLAHKSSEFSEEERVEMVIDDLLQHTISRNEAVERIYEVLRGGDAADKSAKLDMTERPKGEFWHGADCDKTTGKMHVYHFSDCAGGEKCELFKYLSQPGGAEKHMKRGWEYTVTKDDKGGFNFEGKKL